MNQQTLSAKSDTMSSYSKTSSPCATILKTDISSSTKSLKECVRSAMKNFYMTNKNCSDNSNVYEMLLAEIEPALLETTLIHTRGNQSKAARILGISRGTLRKKLKMYDME